MGQIVTEMTGKSFVRVASGVAGTVSTYEFSLASNTIEYTASNTIQITNTTSNTIQNINTTSNTNTNMRVASGVPAQ